MAAQVGSHSFERVSWSREAEDNLASALPTVEDRFAIACQVLDGVSRLWRIDGGKSWLVTRVENPGPELVIVAYQGEQCREVMGLVHEVASRQGFRNLRYHTQYPWLIELFRDYEPFPMEYVIRVHCGKKVRPFYERRRQAEKHEADSAGSINIPGQGD